MGREAEVALAQTALAAVLWGTSFPVVAVGLRGGLDPGTFVFLRLALAAPITLGAASRWAGVIDVTTGVSKMLASNSVQSFAGALRMPIYVLFVRPDFSRYQLRRCEGLKTVQMHLDGLSAIE